jgi:hypothetical protein
MQMMKKGTVSTPAFTILSLQVKGRMRRIKKEYHGTSSHAEIVRNKYACHLHGTLPEHETEK